MQEGREGKRYKREDMLGDIIYDNFGKIISVLGVLILIGIIYVAMNEKEWRAQKMEACIEKCSQSKHADRELCETLCSIQLKSNSRLVMMPLFIYR